MSSDKTITKPTLAPARAFGRVFPIVFVYVLARLSTFHSLEMFENGAFLTGGKKKRQIFFSSCDANILKKEINKTHICKILVFCSLQVCLCFCVGSIGPVGRYAVAQLGVVICTYSKKKKCLVTGCKINAHSLKNNRHL